MKLSLVLSLLLSFYSLCVKAQVPVVQWQKSLGVSINSAQQTSDNGYIAVGSVYGAFNGNENLDWDYLVVKFNSAGIIEWQDTFGGFQSENGNSIRQTTDGGYIVAGSTSSNNGNVSGNHGGGDAWIVKLNDSGDIEWQRCIGGSNSDSATSVQQTLDGGYVFVGSSLSNNGDITSNLGAQDFLVVKLDNLGVLQWQNTFGGSGFEMAYAIKQTNDGGYIMTGGSESVDGSYSDNKGGQDCIVLKLNDNGGLEWKKSLGGSGIDASYSIEQITDGGYILGAYSHSNDYDLASNYGNSDCWVVKLTSDGTIQWEKNYGGSGFEYLSSVQQTSDGGFIMAGQSSSVDGDLSNNPDVIAGYTTGWLVKLDPSEIAGLIASEAKTIKIYPNPVKDVLYIETDDNVVKTRIFNLNGQEIMTGEIHNKTLFLKALAKGVYIMEITDTKGRVTKQKIIKD